MAKRYALVPESWLQQQNVAPTLQNSQTPNPTPSNVSLASPPEKQQSLADIEKILPRNLQSRARMILHYLDSANVHVNDMQRIVYSDGSVGSHIVDLVRYAISPFLKTRPIDWPRFKTLLESIGTPDSIMVKRDESVLKDWIMY